MEPASNRLLRPDRLTPTCWTHQITDYAGNPIDCPGHTKTHTNKGGHIVSLVVNRFTASCEIYETRILFGWKSRQVTGKLLSLKGDPKAIAQSILRKLLSQTLSTLLTRLQVDWLNLLL